MDGEKDNALVSKRAAAALDGPGRRCTAMNRKGERCNRAPIRGGWVCSFHGGNAPGVRRLAEQRMFSFVEPSMDNVIRILTNHGPPCGHCGRIDADDPTVLRACQMVLDRAGLGPTAKIEVEQVSDTAWMQYLEENEVEQIIKLMETAKTRIPADDVTANDEEVLH